MQKPRATARLLVPQAPSAQGGRQLLALAEQHLAQGRVDAAEKLLLQAQQQTPDAAAVNGLLAILALFKGRPGDAVALATRAVCHAPTDATQHFTLGRARKAAGELDEAVQAYRRAIELRPLYAEAHVSLGIALKAQGDLDAAIACYERAIAINPQLAVAHTNLGAALVLKAERAPPADGDEGLPGAASIAAQQRAAELDPQDPEVQRNLGAILLRAGRPAEAMHAFNAALTLDPSDLQACLHLGKCLVDLGDHGLARDLYEKWQASNVGNAEVMRAMAHSLTMCGEADTALVWARRSLALEYNAVTAVQLGNTLLQTRRIPEGVAQCRTAVDEAGRDLALYPVFLMALNYLHETPQAIFDAHAELRAPLLAAAQPPQRRSRAAGEALRLGFVSGDFIRHSVPFFIEPLLRHIDSAHFQVTCYHNNVRSDATTQRLKAFGHRWVECAHLSDDALERRIRADGIDMLIDLTGMTANSRMLMFARAPAPVQLGYLGYPTVTGVPAIAWRITDTTIDPVEAGDMPAFASDRPLALPRSMFCYQPPDAAPALAPPPALQQGHITFGSFNNIAKVTDHTLALWAAAMNAVPSSRLLLKSAAMAQASNRADIASVMARHGISVDRLQLRSRDADDRDHLALYNAVDIALDSYPYNGATTTCEALWMGVPVVTRRGATHTARMGASILGAVGCPDWVTGSEGAFAAAAAALAADLPALAQWRAGARAHIAASALCDGAGMARAFEAALAQAWAAGDTSITATQPPAAAA